MSICNPPLCVGYRQRAPKGYPSGLSSSVMGRLSRYARSRWAARAWAARMAASSARGRKGQ